MHAFLLAAELLSHGVLLPLLFDAQERRCASWSGSPCCASRWRLPTANWAPLFQRPDLFANVTYLMLVSKQTRKQANEKANEKASNT